MTKIKFLICTNVLISISIIYNLFSKIYFEFKGGSIRVIETYKIECGFTNEIINNTFLENASKNLSMHADLCINLARLRIFNIVFLSFLLFITLAYTYISIRNYRPYRPIDDLLKILRYRNRN